MHLPTLPLISHSHVYVEGDVSIDASAAIAAGVILRADPDSKIIIAAGVCIGIGSILHAHQGTLEVEPGANLGAGVLVVGKGKIGTNACIGATTTIWNDSIEPWQVVPPGSLVGDRGRQIAHVSSTSTSPPSSDAPNGPSVSTDTIGQESLNGQVPSIPTVVSTDTTDEDEDSPIEPTAELPTEEAAPSVYGQGNLNRLLKTLFPYNTQSLNRPPEEDG
jgi:carbon dioxide concentrating mechanism protein CcmN